MKKTMVNMSGASKLRNGVCIVNTTALILFFSLSGCGSSSSIYRREAIKQITNQAELAKIVVEDKDVEVCVAAVAKLTDQAYLVRIALEHKYSYVRIMAIRKLTDQGILAKIATEDMDYRVR